MLVDDIAVGLGGLRGRLHFRSDHPSGTVRLAHSAWFVERWLI
jgi:hypothetical protein